jgi:hypothetical protein
MTLNVVIEVEFLFKDEIRIITIDKSQLNKIKEEKNFINLLELHYFFYRK